MPEELKANNRAWAARMVARDPDFFRRLVGQQSPRYLWIGCSDSRVPANQIVGLDPGAVFVHRNVANLAPPQDANYLSVLQFAVDELKVRDIMVVGHYGCGGVRAAFQDDRMGLVDNWLRHVQDVAQKHRPDLDARGAVEAQVNRLCELNVLEQVANVCQTTVIQDAWSRGQAVAVHGWIYDLADGLIRDLEVNIGSAGEFSERYRGPRNVYSRR